MSESTDLYLFTLAGSGMPQERVEGIRLLIQKIQEDYRTPLRNIDSILNCAFEGNYLTWERQVPSQFKKDWMKLPVETRLSLYYVAKMANLRWEYPYLVE